VGCDLLTSCELVGCACAWLACAALPMQCAAVMLRCIYETSTCVLFNCLQYELSLMQIARYSFDIAPL
jgi:hypothetical protein